MSAAHLIGSMQRQAGCIIEAWPFDRLVLLAGLT